MTDTDTQNPTPSDGGASTPDPLTRLEAMLQGADGGSDNPGDEPKPAPETVESDDGATEESQPQLSTSDLAKYLGIDPDALDLDEDGTVKFKTKIDGQEGTAKLPDLFKTYQIRGHAENEAREVARQREALQAREREAEQQFHGKLQQAEAVTQLALNQIHAEFRSIDWNALSAQDPGRAALMRQQYIERDAQLRNSLNGIAQERAQRDEALKENEKARYNKELLRIPEAIPAWVKDGQLNETYLKESAEIQALAEKKGVSREVLRSITQGSQFDAGLLSIIRDGLMYQKMQQDKSAVENKVRMAPKLVKPGTQAVDAKADKLQSLKTAVKKSGGKNGTIEALLLASGKV